MFYYSLVFFFFFFQSNFTYSSPFVTFRVCVCPHGVPIRRRTRGVFITLAQHLHAKRQTRKIMQFSSNIVIYSMTFVFIRRRKSFFDRPRCSSYNFRLHEKVEKVGESTLRLTRSNPVKMLIRTSRPPPSKIRKWPKITKQY